MNAGGIKVNHAGLEQIANDALGTANKINDRLNQLEGELKHLQSDWEGAQQAAYIQAKGQWDKAIEGMIELLREASKTVHLSNDSYKDADKRGQARFGG
ncbi:WXG100 family type VII secretion target [Nocardioides sp.]|uniref:WXG100 family type VII secretion target n=1 Tax=Nocardioides sp. TaxID=35761 RepID=UPI002735D3A3|nr:WXG100 family type VII secretion target [Nocardioides sp.]MDP3889601.1 WXG100 family type VII secretion target [Nocardioides sp.]